MSNPNAPVAFEREREVKNTRGLKMKTSNSRFQNGIEEKKQAEKAKESFDKKAEQFVADRQNQQAKGFDLAKVFMTVIRDKTLQSQKGILASNEEKELREEFQHFILDLNNDPGQKYDGMGSLNAIALLTKTLFEMRDRMNDMEFEIISLKKKIASSPVAKETQKDG